MAVTPPCWQRGSAATNSEGWDVARPLPVGCFVMPEPWVGPVFRSVNQGINWEVLHV